MLHCMHPRPACFTASRSPLCLCLHVGAYMWVPTIVCACEPTPLHEACEPTPLHEACEPTPLHEACEPTLLHVHACAYLIACMCMCTSYLTACACAPQPHCAFLPAWLPACPSSPAPSPPAHTCMHMPPSPFPCPQMKHAHPVGLHTHLTARACVACILACVRAGLR